MRTRHALPAAALLTLAACAANAQVVLNEVFENPPNGGDDTWEYIELYGPPGFDLTGYAVVLIKGGEDDDGGVSDDIPDNGKEPEIDEAFSLDGWTIGPNGTFVLYNASTFGVTGLDDFLIQNPDWVFFLTESPDNKKYFNGAEFGVLQIPSVDSASKLENDGSSTYMLVRRRPLHSINASGQSVYAPGYGWKKDATVDIDYNSRLDFGDEHTFGIPVYIGNGLDGAQTGALQLEPVQVVDEIAWSNASGKEYNTPGRGLASAKLSQTPQFNPDCVVRVRYLIDPLMIGSTVNDNDGVLDVNNIADDSWIYGETRNVSPGSATYTFFKPLREIGDDGVAGTADDELNLLAPVDPNGPFYSYDGPGDDNPLAVPYFEYSGARDPNGTLLFEPYDTTDFEYTPGSLNDAKPGIPLASTPIGRQFRFITGDTNFDEVVNLDDFAYALDHIGSGLDDTSELVRDFNTDDPSDDTTYTGWTYQTQAFNALLAAVRADLTDGTTGEWDSGVTVTQADADAVRALLPNDPDRNADGLIDAADVSALRNNLVDMDGDGDADQNDVDHLAAFVGITPCPADQNADDNFNNTDINLFVTNFLAQDPAGDINGDGFYNNTDINLFVTMFLTQCQ